MTCSLSPHPGTGPGRTHRGLLPPRAALTRPAPWPGGCVSPEQGPLRGSLASQFSALEEALLRNPSALRGYLFVVTASAHGSPAAGPGGIASGVQWCGLNAG